MGVREALTGELTEEWPLIAKKTSLDQKIDADKIKKYIDLGVYLAEEDYWREGLYLLETALHLELERRICISKKIINPNGLVISKEEAVEEEKSVPSPMVPNDMWKTWREAQYREGDLNTAVQGWRKRASVGQIEKHKSYKIEHTHRLLSSVLSEMERRRGFKVAEVKSGEHDPRLLVPLYTGFVQPPEFLKLVQMGTHWKDPTVPGDHGEFTHRIQWYMLLTINNNDGLNKGGDNILEVYKSIGYWYIPANELTLGNKQEKKYISVWDCLFDRSKFKTGKEASYYETNDPLDFRSPENLHCYLIGSAEAAESYPLLSALISGRHQKRIIQGLNDETSVKTEGKKYAEAKKKSGQYEQFTDPRAKSYFGGGKQKIGKPPVLLPKSTSN